MTPDVDADFSRVQVNECGPDDVEVQGARGNAPPEDYKVSLAYHTGFTATAELLVWGSDCTQKAKAVAEIVLARTETTGEPFGVTHVELLGTGAGVPPTSAKESTTKHPPHEVVLRLTVQSHRRDAVQRFAREIAPLITSGPAGIAGYAGRPRVRPILAYWPTRVPKDAIEPIVEVRPAKEWS